MGDDTWTGQIEGSLGVTFATWLLYQVFDAFYTVCSVLWFRSVFYLSEWRFTEFQPFVPVTFIRFSNCHISLIFISPTLVCCGDDRNVYLSNC